MFITKKHLDRRTFLRGAVGTAIALPLLDAMVPAATAQTLTAAQQRFRFGAIYMPNGVYPGTWHPTKAGKDFEFNRTMKPLEPYRDYITTVSRLKAPDGKKDMGGIHMGASAAFLNGTGPLSQNGDFNLIESKKSIDQYIADAIAGDTPLRSLELGTEDMGTSAGACDGYPCVFFNTMSWYDDSSPLPVSVNPQATFERMFGDPGTPEQRLARLRTKQSMLDSVMHETSRLQKVIGAKDNAILDEYLTNIRRVEEQLQKMQARSSALDQRGRWSRRYSRGLRRAHDRHVRSAAHRLPGRHVARVQLDAGPRGQRPQLRPRWCQRAASLDVASQEHAGEHRGVLAHHRVPHGQVRRVRGQAEEHAGRRRDLLDSSLVYFGAGMSNGLLHDRHNVPAALIGRANGRLHGNRHIEATVDEPTSNLLLGMADMLGAEVETIGIATGRLSV